MKHDKRYENLDRIDDYELSNEAQDIRGYPLVTADGRRIGKIDDLLVDGDRNEVAAVRLEDGRCTAVEPLDIHDDVVVYGDRAEAFANRDNDYGKTEVSKEKVIPIVEERVAIGKRVREGGKGMTVTTRVEKEQVSEDVRLRTEEVTAERRDVKDRRVSGEDADAMFEGDSVSMTERSEEAVVAKDAVVTDEVVLQKRSGHKVEHVDETVRKTKVDIEKNKRRDR
ncbi:PRC and DUF2382 domain-containing protein [Sphingomicrobium sp. XHP0235]|uniref:PRC and DUF2382 domain-containing protein n=1 Tax=Sphingomicrobium aquimarinum TaxID=3133971 RepID=UPI0031FF3E2A